MRARIIAVLIGAATLWVPASAHAALTSFATYTGTVGVSTDGFGSLDQTGTISASVPAGATVIAAFLYTSTYFNPTHAGVSSTLAGSPVPYGAPVVNSDICCSNAMARADVTSIIKPLIDGGPGGVYNFTVTEGDGSQDGEALVVVYSLPSLPTSTIGILDGFSATGGDTTSINFATPLDPSAPGFTAEMFLGIDFSCCSQKSTVSVNGTVITENAGNFDDADILFAANGALFTMGGFDDPYSPFLPSYDDDHERYDLVPYITLGDMSIVVGTNNPSRDDNIFLAVFNVSGEASINEPPAAIPEPATLTLLGLGLAAGARRYRRRRG